MATTVSYLLTARREEDTPHFELQYPSTTGEGDECVMCYFRKTLYLTNNKNKKDAFRASFSICVYGARLVNFPPWKKIRDGKFHAISWM